MNSKTRPTSSFGFVDPITSTEKPLLIIASPGSGKTYTLVERTLHLVKEGVKPENILVATFTEKAAKELVTRISNRLFDLNVKVNLNEMYIGTLHSIFLRFLEENREYKILLVGLGSKRHIDFSLSEFEKKTFPIK